MLLFLSSTFSTYRFFCHPRPHHHDLQSEVGLCLSSLHSALPVPASLCISLPQMKLPQPPQQAFANPSVCFQCSRLHKAYIPSAKCDHCFSLIPTTRGLSYDTPLTLSCTVSLCNGKLPKDRCVIFIDLPLESGTQQGSCFLMEIRV